MQKLEQIKESINKLSTALAYLDLPVMILNRQGLLIYLNPAGEEEFGLSYEVSLGRHFQELFSGNFVQVFAQGMERLKQTQQNYKLTMLANEKVYSVHFNPVHKENRYLGALLLLIEEKDLETIQRLNRSLFQTLLDEIYQPINNLTVLFSREFEGRAEEELLQVYQSSQHLIKDTISALNDLVDLSPILIGELKLAQNIFSPLVILKLALRSFRPLAESKKVQLYRLEHKELPKVIGDQAKLNRILVIWLGLFLDMIPRAEIIILSASINLEPAPVLSYSLTGTGMVKSKDNFYNLSCELSPDYARLSPAERKKQKSIVIASRFLLAMRGKYHLESMNKIGTTLSFSVPVSLVKEEGTT